MKTKPLDYYEKNLKLLKKYHLLAWQIVTNDNSPPIGEVFSTDNGQPNLRVINSEGISTTLHDLPPLAEKEIEEGLNLIPESATGVVVLIGMGLGYIVRAILEQRPQIRHLALFDLGPGIFKQALRVLDLSTILSDPRLILSLTPEPNVMKSLAPADKALQLENIYRLRHLNSYKINITAYQKLEQSVFEFISERNIAGNTDQRFGMRFIKNRLSVLPTLHHNHLLEHLQNCFNGIPAILVAGGPSLDKNIHLLPKLQKKTIILAVDSVVPSLLNQGVSPHFMTSIDPQRLNYEKIADYVCAINNTALIATPYVTPEIHQIFPASKIFWTFSSKPIENWMNCMAEGTILTPGSSTAAHVNLTAAIMMGCDPIIFVGQDLAFSGYRDHAAGVPLSNPKAAEKTFFDKNPDAVWIDGVDGKKVPSTRSFVTMKNHFEAMISVNPGPRYINSTEGGALIKGADIIDLQAVLDLINLNVMDITPQFNLAIESARKPKNINISRSIDKMIKNTNGMLQTVSKYDLTIRNIKEMLSKDTKKKININIPKELPFPVQKKINHAESLEREMDRGVHLEIWKILEEGTMANVKESERALHNLKFLEKKEGNAFIQGFIQNLDRLVKLNAARKNILTTFQKELKLIIDFLHKENKFQARINDGDNLQNNFLGLADLYFQAGKLGLLSPILNQLEKTIPNHELIYFYKGVIAACQSQFDLRDVCFNKAKAKTASIKSLIRGFQQKMGNIYFDLCINHKKNGHNNISRNLIFKSLRHCPNLAKLKQEMDKLAQHDLKKIKEALSSHDLKKAEGLLEIWETELKENKKLSWCITNDQISDFYHLYGISLFANKDLDGALKKLDTAFRYTPEKAAMFATTSEIFFSANDFTNGIKYLNKAVEIDRSHAVIWEKLGDRLQENGEMTDAITAYEQGAVALPDHIHLLKKIGDCYRKNGQLEAAQEAYKMVKNKLNRHY